jgi:hypothetical protein
MRIESNGEKEREGEKRLRRSFMADVEVDALFERSAEIT